MNERSERNLQGVHPDLVRVIETAYDRLDTPELLDFIVTEGLRTKARQRQLVATGASQTMNSRHLTGHAVDIAARVGGRVSWDWPLYQELADHIKAAAAELGVPIEWGGDWRSFKDGPHFQLPRGYERRLQDIDPDHVIDEDYDGDNRAQLMTPHSCTTRVFRRGDQGYCVTQIQRILNKVVDADLQLDGVYGAQTYKQVRRFQRLYRLIDDGIIGPESWRALREHM